MDLGALLGVRLGIPGPGPRRTGPDLIGRWIGYLVRGKFNHDDILRTPPLRGELPLGLLSHYAIGAVLGLVYFTLLGAMHLTRTSLYNHAMFGVALGLWTLVIGPS